MKKLLLIFALLLIGCTTFAVDIFDDDTDITALEGNNRVEYLQDLKREIFSHDCAFSLESDEFKKMIKTHKKDKNYVENYYAAQAGYTSFKENNISGMFTPKMDLMYMYALQEKHNIRITYYYNAIGHLKYIDFMYGNYPSFPYFARKYTTGGNLYSTLYCINEMTQIKFNKDGSTAEIWYKGKLIDKIKNIG